MAESDLALLTRAAREAATVATSFIGGDLGIIDKPGGLGPVTKADLAVNARLEETLRGARPDYGWLSEESVEDPYRQSARRTFIVDPIDGTRSFIEGSNAWAHSLAVVEDGAVMAAVILLPLLDRLYAAELGGGARRNGETIRAGTRAVIETTDVLATNHNMAAHFWPGGVPQVTRSYRPSLAYRQSLVAEGRFDAMFTFRPTFEWDVAAGALILNEAGAQVSDRHGTPLRFNGVEPMVDGMLAANPALHAAFLDRLRAAPPDTPPPPILR